MIDLKKEKEAFLVACGEEAKNLYWDFKYEMFVMKKDIGLSHQDWLIRSVVNASAWYMWLESAKAKQSEIGELKAKLEKVKSEQYKQASIYQFEINHLAEANEKWKEVKKQVPKGFVLMPMVPSQAMVDAVRKCCEGESYLPYSLYSEFVNQAIIEAAQENEDYNVGEWDITCPNCKKVIELVAEGTIDYSTYIKKPKEN